MNPNLLIIIYSLFVYLIGGLGMMILNKNLIKKQNLFLNIGLSFCVGNAVLILILYGLAFSANLNLIRPNLGLGLLIFNLLAISVGLIYSLKNRWRCSWQNWLMLLGIIIFLLPLIHNSFYAPLNYWDALGVWLIKAKALFYFPGATDSGFFKDGFFAYTHQDYPLGLPLLVTAFYRLNGWINDQAVQFYLLNYFISFILILTGTMIELTKKRLTLINIFLITLLIIEMPNLILFSHNGYADIPLALFMAAAMKLFLTKRAVPLLALVTLAGASFKVEGYPFLGVILLSFLIKQWLKPEKINKLQTGLAVAAGLTPIIIWEVYKAREGIIGTYSGVTTIDFSRIKTIIHYYLNELVDTNRYLLTLMLAFFVYILELILMISNKMIKQLLPHLIIFGQLGAYTLLYLISPHELVWQLSSFERIALPLIGMLIILIFYNFNCLWPEKNKS